MLYPDEEVEERDNVIHPIFSHVDQDSNPYEENWETSGIMNERMPYFEEESTFEGNDDLGEGCSHRDDFDGIYLWIHDKFYDTLACFKRTLFPRLECTLSYHEVDYTRDVESLKDHLQHMDVEKFTYDQILKHLEEVFEKIFIGELHHEMVVMLGPQYILSPHEKYYGYSECGLGMYDSNEVHSQPMIFSHDTLFFQFDY